MRISPASVRLILTALTNRPRLKNLPFLVFPSTRRTRAIPNSITGAASAPKERVLHREGSPAGYSEGDDLQPEAGGRSGHHPGTKAGDGPLPTSLQRQGNLRFRHPRFADGWQNAEVRLQDHSRGERKRPVQALSDSIKEEEPVKVKFGSRDNEVFAEIASSRLMWALGFYTDAWFPVRVECHNCPADPESGKGAVDTRMFDPAIIVRSSKAQDV